MCACMCGTPFVAKLFDDINTKKKHKARRIIIMLCQNQYTQSTKCYALPKVSYTGFPNAKPGVLSTSCEAEALILFIILQRPTN